MSDSNPEVPAAATVDEAAAAAEPAPAPVSERAVDSDHVTVLEYEGKTLYILGTAHVSKASVEEVERLIEEIRPDTVCVELCEARFQALTDRERWKKLDIFEVIKGGKTLFLLANLAVGAYQRRLGAELGVQPGAELLAAVDKAQEVGAEVILADRDIHVTLKRTWGNLGFWKKTQLLGAVVGSLFSREQGEQVAIEDLKEKAHLSEMMAEFARVMPQVKEPLIDERDHYLVSMTREAPGERIVSVVGAGHAAGMAANLATPIDRRALEKIPPKKWWTGLLKWIIPALLIGAFYFGFQKEGPASFEQLVLAWVLPNSIAAAVLTALVGGTLASIVTAFIASPITSLNPLIGCGMVTGVVEAWRRKPTVEDAENINRDVQSFKGFFRNRFTRVLVVVVASTLGSAIGAWIGLGWVLTKVS
ncbi:MAG: TraB/GumN family protein [Myxococcales bacterium]|nr:TraB/GumN family protein [Myxococcales bacterium]MCB9733747.1 TraB/GumN family protein [Deltaproteobacteria bacterium]